MNKKLILIICLVLCFFITLSAVYSTENIGNETLSADDQQNTLKTNDNLEIINKQSDDCLKMNEENLSDELQSNNEKSKLVLVDEDVIGYDNPGSFSELYDLIHSPKYANDYSQIFLDRDYVYNPQTDAAYKDGVYFNNNYLIINGKGHTIDGAGQARILKVGGTASGHTSVAGVIIMNINFVNAYNDYWNQDNYRDVAGRDKAKNDDFGAIEFWGTGSVENCNFINGYAWCAAGIAIGGGSDQGVTITNCKFINNTGYGTGGGAIRLRTDAIGINVSKCWFENNKGLSYGGAMHSDSGRGNWHITVDDCDFINNTAGTGAGGLFFETTGGIVRNSRFVNNTAPLGGALYWNGFEGEISNCNFTGNDATDKGGAIYTSQRATTTITTSNFKDNSADYGGAIYFDNTTTSAISSCSFYNNFARYDGGAIYCNGQFFNVVNSNFTKDSAKRNGGAIFLDVGAYVYNCQFDEEHADVDGGGIYLYSKVTELPDLPEGIALGVFSTNFTTCTAGHDGGAGYVNSNWGVVKDSILKDCTAVNDGGAGYIKGDFGKLINSQLINNVALGNGGALYWEGAEGSITNTVYRQNRARGNGGGVYWQGDNGNITNCNFTENIGIGDESNGGAIYVEGNNLNITFSDFKHSSAKDGSAIYIKGANTNVLHSNFTEIGSVIEEGINDTTRGGGIYIEGHNAVIYDDNFEKNNAGRGGAIYIAGNDADISYSTFDFTNVTHDGSSIYISGNGTNIIHSSFAHAYAKEDGGALYVGGHNTHITHSTFEYLNATRGGAIFINGSGTQIQADFSYCFATKNANPAAGGAIYVEGDENTILNSTFKTTIATGGNGGAIYVAGDKTEIYNITTSTTVAIRNGPGKIGNGGAIYIEGDDTNITYSRFQFGSAENGGAIYIEGRNAHILHSNITQFGATADGVINPDTKGGGAYIAGYKTVIDDVLFMENNAANGGSLYITGNEATIKNSNFTRTKSTQAGGAMYIMGNDTHVEKSNFTFSVTDGDGGAIYVGGVDTQILSSTFSFTNATHGGSIYIKGNNTYIESNFDHTFAKNNGPNAGAGGAIFISGDNNKVYNSNFTITMAVTGSGGAIYAGGLNTTIYNIHSDIAKAMGGGPGMGNGGAIYISGNSSKVLYSTFEHYNATLNGGGLYVEGNNVNISHSSFEFGEATLGGGIYIQGHDTYMGLSNLTHNHAHVNGGVIYIEGNHSTITDSRLEYSYANISGGAVFINGENNLITKSNLTHNNATALYGGSIYINGAKNNISYSKFEFCTSTRGGAIYINGADAHVIYSNFSQNGMNPVFSDEITETAGGTIFIAGDNAIIDHDKFERSNADNGGFIYVNGSSARITNSNFTQSIVEKNGGAIYVAGEDALIDNDKFMMNNATNGGAIYVSGNNANITNSSFTITTVNSTTEVTHGGSIYISGHNVDIIKCDFNIARSGNGDGGAIYVTGNSCDIKDSTFSTTLAIQGDGGTIYISGNNSQIKNITSDIAQAIGSLRGPPGNQVEYAGLGGSVYISGNNVNMTDAHFIHYGAMFKGGAVYVEGDDVNIDKSTFAYGESEYGGSVYINGEKTHISNSNFSYTHASIDGGVIYINGNETQINNINGTFSYSNQSGGSIFINGHKTKITDSSFQFNNATSAYGGSIYIKGNDTNITGTLFQFSTSTNGGAIYINGTDAKIYDSTFNQNRVSVTDGDGGTIFIEGKNALISGSNFTQSNARDGGFIFVKGVNANIKNSNFDRSQAYRYGGAIYIGGDDTTVSDCNFSRHNATSGGAIYINGSNAAILKSNFTMCNAVGGSGGAIFVAGIKTTIIECNLTMYNATKNGGALYIDGSYANITKSYFEYGEAIHGGAVFIQGNYTYVDQSDFMHNHASQNGGIIYINGSHARINNSNLKFSYSNQSGGAIYIEGEYAKVANSNLTFNNATEHFGGSIYIEGGNANITGSLFAYCTSTNGGAIFVNGTNTSISDSEFMINRVSINTGNGGTIYIAGNNALISASNFTQSNARDGGFIYVEGANANITQSKFKMSNAFNNGGAIYIGGENTTVSNSTFEKHNATNYGGAIYIAGVNTKIKTSNFTECNAKSGGAIYVDGHNATLIGCNLTKYNATLDGGAVYIEGDNVNVTDSYFEYGEATHGGAIYVRGENTYMSGSNFTHNHASKDGGIIYIEGNNSKINNSNFKYSYSNQSGGAIYIKGVNTTIFQSNFTNNNATQKMGGSIYIEGVNTRINGSSFENCSSKEGGALYIKGDDATVYNSNFTRNLAQSLDNNTGGGSIYIYGENAVVSYSNFSQSKAKDGGFIYIRGSEANITHSNFERSEASRFGGAVYVAGINATIDSSTFNRHNATSGGAVYISGKNTRVTDSDFTDSHATSQAGGVYLGPHTTVLNSTFSFSSAGQGGAMYNSGGTAIVAYSNFTNNSAKTHGGGIFWQGGTSFDRIVHCYFENNTVDLGGYGGGIYWSEGNSASNLAIIEDSTFVHNYAGKHGGAIDWYRSNNGIIRNCTFIENWAHNDGGAIYAGDDNSDGENLTIVNCTFTRNHADIDYGKGGALSLQFYNSRVIDCNFTSNYAHYGGSVEMRNPKSNHTQYINCRFINSSTTKYSGGACIIYVEYIDFINCTFENCTTPNSEGSGIYFDEKAKNANVIGCEFINCSNSTRGGAISARADNLTVKNSTFNLNQADTQGGAIYISGKYVIITNSTFENNNVSKSDSNMGGGAIYIDAGNTLINDSTFTDNYAGHGGAICIKSGTNSLINASVFNRNNAVEGGAIFIYSIGNILNKLVIENSTAKHNGRYGGNGGAIMDGGANNITDSIIRFNVATNGGAIYYYQNANNNFIINTNITNNNATKGSAIYATKSTKYSLINVTLLENQAHANKFTDKSIKMDDNGLYYVTAIFRGNDNLLNAIWNENATSAVQFTNVTYWDADGVTTTNTVPELSDAEAGMNITVTKTNVRSAGDVVVTDENGAFKYYFEDDGAKEYKFTFRHYEDNYYTDVEDSISIKTTNVIIEIADIDFGENATVNVTLKDRDGNKLTGTVRVIINNTHNFTMTITNGFGSVNNVTGLPAGLHNATVIYEGNTQYLGSRNSTTFTVRSAVNVKINKTVDLANVSVGKLINFTIEIHNYGESTANNVWITDALPTGLVYIKSGSNSTDQGVNDNGIVKWNISTLGPHQTVRVWVQVNTTVNGTFGNVAVVSSTEGGSNSSNTTNITVNPVVNLTIIKEANIDKVQVGDLVNFTITVINNGPSNSTGVKISDVLDKAFEWVNSTGEIRPDANRKLVWTINHIENGTNASVWVLVRVLTNGTFTNVATVNCTENKTDITSNDTNVTVNPKVNLTVIKNVTVSNASVGDLVNFTIIVTNHGPSNATGVNVTDYLPIGMIPVKYGSNTTGSVTISNTTLTNKTIVVLWHIDKIINSSSIKLWVLVNLTTNGTFANVAFANSNENRTNSTNSTNITVDPKVNLTVVKTTNLTGNASVGDLVKFNITVTNNGPSNATNVTIFDKLDSAFEIVSAPGNYTISGNNVTWIIPHIENGKSASVFVIVKLLINGTFTNVASVSSVENKTNSTNSTNITVKPVVDIVINKTVDKTNVTVGDIVIFTITVKNNGPSNATGVYVIDVLDGKLKYLNSTATQGKYNETTHKWVIGNITKGLNVTLKIKAQVISNGTIPNFANVTGNENDTNLTNNNDTSDNITANPQVNLTIIKTTTATNASVGDLVNFTIVVTNNGLSNATNVNVTDLLPNGMIYRNAGANMAGVNHYTATLRNGTNIVYWIIPKLTNGSSIKLWLLVNLTTNGTFTNVAFANSNENKTNSTNSTNITVDPKVNLTVIKYSNVTVNASVGDLVNFTINVTNNGPSNATNVTIFDKLDSAFEIVSAPGNKTVSGNNVTWVIPHIENGKSASVYVIVRLLTNGTFTNVASVSSVENKTNSTNSTNIAVKPVVDLVITKNVTKTEVLVGDTVVYTITVKNNGPSNATGVYVIDKLDKRLELTNVYLSQGNYDYRTGRWTIGNITKGASVILNLTVKILTNGTIPNFANVTGNENDTNITNNNVTSDNITANPKVNLTVIKTLVTQGTIYVGDLVNYTITVTNYGPSNATNVQIVDNLNSALRFVSANGTYTNSTQRVNWTIPFIANGTSVTVWIQVRVLTNGTIENIAAVNSTENTTTIDNGTNITVQPKVNLTVVKIGVANASVGDLVNFTIIVTNYGPSNATGVNVTDILPNGMIYVNSGSNMTGVTGKNITESHVFWNIPLIINGTSVKLWVLVNLTTNGTFRNVAVINSTENTTSIENGTNITVKPVVDLVINKTVNKTDVYVGDTVEYIINVTNKGPSNATGVYVIDKLDERLKLINVIPSQGNYDNGTGRWTIDNITSGASVTLKLIVQILTNGTIPNFANVTGNENDTNITNNNVTSDNITAKSKVNLTVVKVLVTQGTIYVGDLVNYTITVTNYGPSNATNVQIVDILDNALMFVKANGTYTNSTQRVNWTIPTIANGSSVTVWIQVRVLTNGTIENIAVVNSTENTTTVGNGTNITVEPQVNLTVVKTIQNSTAHVGDLVNFTIIVTNDGLSNATGVNITDFLPAGMLYIASGINMAGVVPINTTLSNGTTKVVWFIPLLNNGSSVRIWIQVNLTTNGTFRNVAVATSNENTTNTTNGTNITVNPAVDLVITKNVTKTEVLVGDTVVYTITVKNNGPSNATGVYVIDKLDKRLELINVYVSQGDYNNRTGRWTIGNITNGASVILNLTVKILTNGTIPNFANVTGNENDTNITNNNVTSDNITANPKVNLTVIKTLVTQGTIYVGDLVNYTITVTNYGPSNATNVQIVDNLNGALQFVLANGTYTNSSQRVNWTIPSITNGSSVTVWIQVRVLTNGTIENIAVVNSTENKTNIGNGTNITVEPQVNLTVVKTAGNVTANVGDLVNFTIVVTNNGLSNATGVNVTDFLPSGMKFVGFRTNATGVTVSNIILSNGTTKVTWYIPLINNNTSIAIWIQVNLTTNGTFTNVAVANANENTTNTSNSTNITVKPVVDLVITKTVSETVVLVGDSVVYTITVKNNGPSNATGVYVIDKLDKRLELTHVYASKGDYNNITGRWTIGNITKGASVILNLTVKILTNGTIPNFANVTGNENDTNITNNNVTSDNITVNPKVNLTVVKVLVTQGTIYVGDLVNYTITVTNYGPSNATNVQIVDNLNGALKFVSANGTYTNSTQRVNWTIPAIANGSSVTVWIQVRVLTNGTIENIAVVNSTENTTTIDNGTNITVEPQVNLTVVKTADNVTANVGDLVNFTIVVTNNGLSNATGVNVTDFLPSGMNFVGYRTNATGVSVSNITLSNGTTKVTWHIPLINNNTSIRIWIQVNLTTNGTFTNVAVANANENTTNTSNSTNITVKPVVDLVITKTVSETVVSVGDSVVYTITVKNNGPSNATGVYVIDKLDKRLELIDIYKSQGNYDNRTGRWTIGNITKGASVILNLTVKILTNGTIPNFANVTGNENDTNITNNNVTSDNITANPKVNLTVVKVLVTQGTIYVGDLINYTITVTNNGPSNATNVVIVDELIPELKFVTAKEGYTNSSQKVTWTVPFIANGTSTTVWIQVRALSNGTLKNMATVNCSENKTDVPSNITNVTVKPQVNLTIVKTINNSTAHVGDVVNFTIIVTNNGLSNATNVTVVDMLPLGMIYKNAGSNITDCQVYNRILENQTHMITWVISKIMNGTSVKLWVLVNLTTNGTFRNVAAVNSTENNTDVSNGTNITVKPTVNLIINKTVNKTDAYVGDIVKYTIEISNKGLSNATGIKVTDCLDEKLKFINSTATSGSYNNITHIWTIDNITSGGHAKLEIFARIITNGTIPNIAIVNCTENSTNKNASSENITAKPQVNLTVIKTANVTGIIYVGDIVNYTITVTNNGLSNATNVTIVDDLIAAFKFDDANGTYVHDGQKITWTFDKLENGTSKSLWITVKVLTNGTLGNFVVVNSTENTTDVPSNVTNITVQPRVNLTIIKTVDKVNASVGELVNFTIIVTNYGPSNATGVNVTDLLPAGMIYKDSGSNITGLKGHVDLANASRVIWNIDKIVNGTSVKLWLLVNLTTNGTFRNVAVVASNENRTNTTNGTNITVKPVVDLVITKTVKNTTAHVGDIVEYTITVTNNGPSNATGVYVIDVLDSKLKYDNFTATQGKYNETTHKWVIGNITSGNFVTLTIKAKVIMNGTIPNFANVTVNENDTNITNNNDTSDNVTALPQVNLTVIKTVDHANATVGDVVKFTITVTNNGLSNATNVNISDVLNSAFKFEDAYGGITPVNGKLVWTIGKIANGTNASVWVQVRLLTNGTFTNVAVANCSENTTNVPSNDTNITVKPNVNLTIVKTANPTNASVGDLVNFTITVTNNGLSNATHVVISDTLNVAFELVKSYNNVTMDSNRKLEWIIDKLENGTSASVWVQVRLLTNGTFTNIAHVNSTENTTDVPSNGTNITVKPKSNITIIKYADIAEGVNISVGNEFKFIIVVKNNGPSNATDVIVSDTLNEAFGFKDSNTTYELDGRKVTWKFDKLNVNETVTIELRVNATKNGFFSNVAVVNSTESENVTSNETVVTILPAVNLTAVKTANLTGNASVGDLVNFTITVYNKGPSNATNVNITDILPSGMMYVKSSAGGVNATVDGVTTVTWNIGNVNLRQTVEVWVVVKVLANGTLRNTVKANSTENTTGITNHTDINVTPVVDLSINKTVDRTNVTIGDTIVYTITVKNNGPSNATNVEVTENIKGEVYVSPNPSKGTYANNIWTIPLLKANETATLTLTVKVLKAGTVENSVVVKADQNDTNLTNNNYTCENVTVNKIDTPIKLETENITYGDEEPIKVTLPVNATGTVNITVGNVTYPDQPINNGVVELTIPDLAGGEYNVTVTYPGDNNYNGNSTKGSFKVSPRVPEIKIEVVDIWYGEVEVLNVTVNAPGFVNITVDNGVGSIIAGLNHTVQVKDFLKALRFAPYDGKATWNLIRLAVGQYNVTATYLGNENYTSVSTDAVFNVRALPSVVNVTADDIYVGEDAIIKVSLTPGATGNVTITIDGKDYPVNITDGKGQITVPGLKAGVKDVKVTYDGDEHYLPSENSTTFNVKKIKPPIDVDSEDIYVGDDETITVTLPSDATGTVTITVGGKKYTADVVDGKATFTVPGLKAGKYTVDASYSGDDKYLSTTGSDKFKVSKMKPDVTVDAPDITVGDDGTITVTLPDDATGKVTIEVEGKRYTADVINGKAVFKVPGLSVGVHGIKVWYSGDDKYLPTKTTDDITVHPVNKSGPYHEPKGLEKHATGNPIIALIIVLVAIVGVNIRKFRK